jgi:hypothetical protein
MNFKEVKERIKIIDVLLHYGIRLRKRVGEDYAGSPCPLPTHPEDRNNNCFAVHLPTNRWQCKHPACGRNNGVGDKWGDCINLVATLDKISFLEAGKKLERWFPKENPAPSHGESREREERTLPPPAHIRDDTSSSVAVNYMASIDLWFTETFKLVPDEEDENYWKRVRKAVKSKLVDSYRAGQKCA